MKALASAREHLGGDCLLSLHLLTDNVTGVAKEYNPAFIPYREWPLSGLRVSALIHSTLSLSVSVSLFLSRSHKHFSFSLCLYVFSVLLSV